MSSRTKVAAVGAEFLGAGLLAFLVLTISRSNIGIPYFVSIAAGLVIVLLSLAIGRNMQFNPAFTLALWTARRNTTVKTLVFIIAQFAGAMSAYLLYKSLTPTNEVQALPTGHKGTILVAEAVGAFVFAFGAAGALYRQYHPIVRAVVTGGSYTLGVMAASVAAAGFINPAVAGASNAWGWSTYFLGPVLGALLGVNLYALLFADRPGRAVATATASADRSAASVAPAAVVSSKPAAKTATKTTTVRKTTKVTDKKSKKTKK